MKFSKNVYRSLAMITQFGINMLVPIFMCSFVGMWLDRKLETSYWMIILFFVGAIAGFRNIWVFSRKIYTVKETRRKRSTDVNKDQKSE